VNRLVAHLVAGLVLGTVHLAALAQSQGAPAGWQSVRDAAGHCQLSVPKDWTLESEGLPGAAKEGTTYSAHFFPVLAQTTFAQARDQAKQAWSAKKGFTVIEESDKRAVYRFTNAGAAQWTVIVGSSPVCQASVMGPQADDATAVQVVQSLTAK